MSVSAEPHAFIVSFNEGRPGFRMPISGPTFTIGRDTSTQLCIDNDPTVSRQHCAIHVVGRSLMLEDLNSRNGTFLDGKRLTGLEPVLVAMGSEFVVGQTRLRIEEARPFQSDVTHVFETTTSVTGIRIPTDFDSRTEAYMVVDLVDSTSLVQREDNSFAKVILVMGRLLDRMRLPFLKCTGDGFFACFTAPNMALDAGTKIAPSLARALDVDVQISVALHWGTAQLTETEDRTGRDIHAVFSLEQVRHQDTALEAELRSHQTKELVLMTEAFWRELDEEARAKAALLGLYRLKGIEEGAQIYRWHN